MGSHTYEILLALGVLSPFVGFWLLVFFGARLGKPASGWLAVVLGMGVPLVLATYVLIGWYGGMGTEATAALTENAYRYHWATLGDIPITIGVKLDSLTVGMYFMVAFIAFWIFVFSIGYMSGHSDEVDGKSKYHRFFAYLCLFGFSMLGLVASSSLLFLFIFWELVGLCSYLLIGYYFDKAYASAAAMKAFITNRVGDFGFLIGLMLVVFYLRTFDLDAAADAFAHQYVTGTGIFASSFTLFGWSLATIMGIGLFCGAMGKSAQFPLHVWLPDAMAGPTPVSALIHAATMVAAGVYLVARVFRLMTPEALMFVATIGCLTLTLMALIAIVQVDIKKCLAYSTLSQLGYMIFGMGCGAWIAALFHLITHAFFKAMLFLGSGQVIEGCHHEQDMRKMGGLMKKMPYTGVTFLVGVLAISGAGIAGTSIGLGGFFSKDEILAVAYARSYEWDAYSKHEAEHGDSHHATARPTGPRSVPETYSTFEPQASGRADLSLPLIARTSVHDPMGAVAKGTPNSTVRLVSNPINESQTNHAAPRGLKPAARVVTAAQGHGERAEHAGTSKAAIFRNTPPLPKWMFWLAIITAYVTPFYMMRCWWMTFMGKPRDEHVHHHAHEIPLMYVPLVVLAIGTFVSGYFLFRPLFSDAATQATAAVGVMALDGHVHTRAINAAHHWLMFGVGGAFIVGFAIAILIYRRGLETANAIKRIAGPLYILLEKKYFFDEVYGFVWVKGCVLVAKIARFIDTWLVDFIFNILAFFTERLATFSGMVVDKHGVDGVMNGIATTSVDIARGVRTPQTGRIRNYVLAAACVATMVLLGFLIFAAASYERVVDVTAAVP